jgi:hypothetical protein
MQRGWIPLGCLIAVTGCTGLIDEPGSAGKLGGQKPKDVVVLPTIVISEPLHRLNRVEYDNTVRDLLGTSLAPARAFPPDTAVGGFDNAADALTMPASLFALYSEAARELVETSLRIAPRYTERLEARSLGIAGNQTGAAFENWGWTLIGRFTGTLRLPQAEQVTLSILVGGGRTAAAPVPIVSLWVDGVKVQTWTVTAPAANPQTFTAAVAMAAGARKVEVSFDNRMNEPAANEGNQLILGWVSAVSTAQSVPPNRSVVYRCEPVGPTAPDCYEDIVATFAQRAWRRPLELEERGQLLALYRSLAASEGAANAVELSLRAILVSPRFLYRPSFAGESGAPTHSATSWMPLDDYVLASRLSYFLWSTMPDAELMADAEAGVLRTDEGLKAAVARMLADPKAIALRSGFAASWLGAKALATATPELGTYPSFTEPLKAAMAEEAELFFEDFLRNGQPVTNMLLPDFAYVNDTLAKHYGMRLPDSTKLVRVRAREGERRGILMQGAWLTSSSDPTHTSPVRRGRWVLEQLLDTDIPPPPPGIPPLPTDEAEGTIRERLAEHRKSPTCASCHNRVDPIGLGLEEFDGIGARRELENGLPVDKSGALNGRSFQGAEDLAKLLQRDERFLPSLIGKLHTYAMGRGRVKEDRAFVVAIEKQLALRGDRLDALIELIVLSPSFRMSPIVAEAKP